MACIAIEWMQGQEMKHLAFLLPLVAATPAFADWQLRPESTKKTWSFAAFESDKTGSLELQFFCDHEYPGEVQMLVFTGADWTAEPDAQTAVEMIVTIDGTAFPPLSGFDDDVDAERVVYADTLDDKALFDVIDAAKAASRSIVVDFEDTTYRFGVAKIEPMLTEFMAGCAQESPSN